MEKNQTLNYKIDCIANHIQTQKSDYCQIAFSEWMSIMQEHAKFSVDQELDLIVEQIKLGKVNLDSGQIDITAVKKATRMQQFVGFLVSNHQNIADNIEFELEHFESQIPAQKTKAQAPHKSSQIKQQEQQKHQEKSSQIAKVSENRILEVPRSQGFEKYCKIYQWQIRFSPEEAEFVRMSKEKQVQYLTQKWHDLKQSEHQQFEDIDISELFLDKNPMKNNVERNEDEEMNAEPSNQNKVEDQKTYDDLQQKIKIKRKRGRPAGKKTQSKRGDLNKDKIQTEEQNSELNKSNNELIKKVDNQLTEQKMEERARSASQSESMHSSQTMAGDQENRNQNEQNAPQEQSEVHSQTASQGQSKAVKKPEDQIAIDGSNKSLIQHLSQIGKK